MPFYQDLNAKNAEDKRTLKGLIRLRKALKTQIPQKTLNETILVATWNIRDFDKPAYGERYDEALYYTAEIINCFDVVAVQEVYKDLKALRKVMRLLGSDWEYIFGDTTEGHRGNDERMAFIYDSRKIRFGGLAGELVVPPIKIYKKNSRKIDKVLPSSQIWRTPFIAGFRSGWAKFMMCQVHILWGEGKKDEPQKVEEIRQIAQFLKRRTQDQSTWARKLILLGDFNIFNRSNKGFKELLDAGFTIPPQLEQFGTNANKDRHYDQIVLRERDGSIQLTGEAGVFDFFDYVFRLSKGDERAYKKWMGKSYLETSKGRQRNEKERTAYYKKWRTHQLSDHLPMWVEMKVDYSDEYINSKLNG